MSNFQGNFIEILECCVSSSVVLCDCVLILSKVVRNNLSDFNQYRQSKAIMAKNTSSSAFRKIDIDQYNEDNFREDEAEQSIPTGPDENEVCSLLNQGRHVEALKMVLTNAPMGSSNQMVKDSALALTLKVLLAIKSAQIEEMVGNLTRDDVDILMKYIYRGFEYPSEGSSGHLLLWHEKAFNIGGSGSIVRVLSDRMKV